MARAVARRAFGVHRQITIDRNDIIMGLADIAQQSHSDRARVAAPLGLADIFFLRATSTADLKSFIGWTADEIDRFILTLRLRPVETTNLILHEGPIAAVQV
jgi:hypothetical protein